MHIEHPSGRKAGRRPVNNLPPGMQEDLQSMLHRERLDLELMEYIKANPLDPIVPQQQAAPPAPEPAPAPTQQPLQPDPRDQFTQDFDRFMSWSSQGGARFEQAQVDSFIRNLRHQPADPGYHPDWMSAIGRRRGQVEAYGATLSPEGQRHLYTKMKGALDRDDQSRKEAHEAAVTKMTKPPSFREAAWGYVGPYVKSVLDPIHHGTLGLMPSMTKGMEEGINDAMIQVLVQQGREEGIEEENLIGYAMNKINTDTLPTAMQIAHMSAMLPEIAYSMPAFWAIEAGTGGLGTPAILGRIGLTAARAGKYASWAEKAGTLGKLAKTIVRPVTATAKTGGTVESFALGSLGRPALTFGGAGAVGAPHEQQAFDEYGLARYDDDGNPVMEKPGYWSNMPTRFAQGALAGAVVGLSHPMGRALEKDLPAWMNPRYWDRKMGSHFAKEGVPEGTRSLAHAIDPKTGKAVFKVGEMSYEVEAWHKSMNEHVARFIDLPGRIGEGLAFSGMAFTHGAHDAKELMWQFGAGFVGKGHFTPVPMSKRWRKAIRRHVPGTRDWREKMDQQQTLELVRYQSVDVAARTEELAKDVESKLAQVPFTSPEFQKVLHETLQGETGGPDRPHGPKPEWSEIFSSPEAKAEATKLSAQRRKELSDEGKRNTTEYRNLLEFEQAMHPDHSRVQQERPNETELARQEEHAYQQDRYETARREMIIEEGRVEMDAYFEDAVRTEAESRSGWADYLPRNLFGSERVRRQFTVERERISAERPRKEGETQKEYDKAINKLAAKAMDWELNPLRESYADLQRDLRFSKDRGDQEGVAMAERALEKLGAEERPTRNKQGYTDEFMQASSYLELENSPANGREGWHRRGDMEFYWSPEGTPQEHRPHWSRMRLVPEKVSEGEHLDSLREATPGRGSEIQEVPEGSGNLRLIAREGGDPVGQAILMGDMLMSVDVDPAARRQGHGRRLVEAAVARGAKMGSPETEAGEALLRAMGWKQTGPEIMGRVYWVPPKAAPKAERRKRAGRKEGEAYAEDADRRSAPKGGRRRLSQTGRPTEGVKPPPGAVDLLTSEVRSEEVRQDQLVPEWLGEMTRLDFAKGKVGTPMSEYRPQPKPGEVREYTNPKTGETWAVLAQSLAPGFSRTTKDRAVEASHAWQVRPPRRAKYEAMTPEVLRRLVQDKWDKYKEELHQEGLDIQRVMDYGLHRIPPEELARLRPGTVLGVEPIELVGIDSKGREVYGPAQRAWRIRIMRGEVLDWGGAEDKRTPEERMEGKDAPYDGYRRHEEPTYQPNPREEVYVTTSPKAMMRALENMKAHTGDPKVKKPTGKERAARRALRAAPLREDPADRMRWPGGEMDPAILAHVDALLESYVQVQQHMRSPNMRSQLTGVADHRVRMKQKLEEIEEALDGLFAREAGHFKLIDALRVDPTSKVWREDPLFRVIAKHFPHFHTTTFDGAPPVKDGAEFRPQHHWEAKETRHSPVFEAKLSEHFNNPELMSEIDDIGLAKADKSYSMAREDAAHIALTAYRLSFYKSLASLTKPNSRTIARLHREGLIKASEAVDKYIQILDRWYGDLEYSVGTEQKQEIDKFAKRRMEKSFRERFLEFGKKEWMREFASEEMSIDKIVDDLPLMFMSQVNHEFRGGIILHMQKVSQEFRDMSPEGQMLTHSLFLNALSKELFPKGRSHAGTTYSKEAQRFLTRKLGREPTQGEVDAHAKKLRMFWTKHVRDMMTEFKATFDLAEGGISKSSLTSGPLEKMKEWMGEHPWLTAALVGSVGALGLMDPTGVAGATMLAGLPLGFIAWGTKMVKGSGHDTGFRGSQSIRNKLLGRTNGFLRSFWDTAHETETHVTYQDLKAKGDLTGMKKWLTQLFGLPEMMFGTRLHDAAMMAHINAGNAIEKYRNLAFENQGKRRAWFDKVKEDSPLDHLLFDALDGFRRTRKQKRAKMGTKEWETQLDKRIKDEGIDRKEFDRVFKELDRWRTQLRDKMSTLPGGNHWSKKEFGLDDYWHYFFPKLDKDPNWYDAMPRFLKSLIKKPKDGREAHMMSRGESKSELQGSALRSFKVNAPAAEMTYEMMKFGRETAKQELFGKWDGMGWRMRRAGQGGDPLKGEGDRYEMGDEKTELESMLMSYSVEQTSHYDPSSSSGVGGILFNKAALERFKMRADAEGLATDPKVGKLFEPGHEWFLLERYKATDDFVHVIHMSEAHRRRPESDPSAENGVRGKLGEAEAALGKKEGWIQEVPWREMREAKIRQGGLISLGQNARMAEAEKWVDYQYKPVKEKYAKIFDAVAGWLYHTTIGGLDPRPAMHNLIGGQWLNYTELGLKYWGIGSELALGAAVSAAKAPGFGGGGITGQVGKGVGKEPNDWALGVLRKSGMFMEGSYFTDHHSQSKLSDNVVLKTARKVSFWFFKKAEDMNRAIGYLGAYKRAMDRIERETRQPFGEGKAFDANKLMGRGGEATEALTQGQWAHREAVRGVGRTAAFYSVVNAPGIFRNPMGRLFMHLNRFSVMYMNEALRAWQERSIRPGRLARGLVSGMLVHQLGQQLGADLGFIFGQRVSDLGIGMADEDLTLGAMFPALHQGDGSPAGIVGDAIIPISTPYDWAPPVRVGMDAASVVTALMTDDMDTIEGLGYQMGYRYRHMLEMMIPTYRLARRTVGATTAVVAEDEDLMDSPMRGLVDTATGKSQKWLARVARFTGMMPIRIKDGKREKPYEMVGFRERLNYRANKETLIRRLLAPGIPTPVMKEIRQSQIDRSIQNQMDANRQRGFDRFLSAMENNEYDVMEEMLDQYAYRPQDIKRQWDLRQHPGWIRRLSGTSKTKIERLYDRWEKQNTPQEEIVEGLTVHITSIEDLDADSLSMIGDMLRNSR